MKSPSLSQLISAASTAQEPRSQKGIYQDIYEIQGEIPPGDCLEIGVLFGKTTIFLSLLWESLYPDHQILSADPFTRGSFATSLKGRIRDSPDEIRRAFEVNTASLKNHLHFFSDSSEAAALIPPGRLSFAFVDGDHSYEGVMADFEAFRGKMVPGGIISFDDYRNNRWPGVGRAVAEIRRTDGVECIREGGKAIFLRFE